jgi:electron transport complex protein RnfG
MKNPIIAIVLSAVILFGASFGLQDVARKNAQQAHLDMMRLLLPGSQQFTVEPYAGEDANIRSVHKGENGFVIETVTRGYADDIRMMIAVSNDGKVTGLVVLEAQETFGLGGRVLYDHEFLSQFLNHAGSFSVGEPGADAFSGATGAVAETEDSTYVDAISGATVTSKAVARCVNSAVSYVTGADADSGATSWGG